MDTFQTIESILRSHKNAFDTVGVELRHIVVRLIRSEYLMGLMSAGDALTWLKKVNSQETNALSEIDLVNIVEEWNQLRDRFRKSIRDEV